MKFRLLIQATVKTHLTYHEITVRFLSKYAAFFNLLYL